jgi:hypothetical protein
MFTPCREAVMKVEISVKVDGGLVEHFTKDVDGTLEQMEEIVHELSREVARSTLQASVDAVDQPRPLFRPTGGSFAIRDIASERSSG